MSLFFIDLKPISGLDIRNKKSGERGNALFLILIAVVLFAALSYAVTRSGSGGATNAREKVSLIAARMVSNANMMTQAINRVMLVNKCTDVQLNFTGLPAYSNAFAPADHSCDLFDPAGGGLAVSDWMPFMSSPDYTIGGSPRLVNTYAPLIDGRSSYFAGTPTAGGDLTLMSPVFSLDLCNALNTALNVPASTLALQVTSYGQGFFGDYSPAPIGTVFPAIMGGCGTIPAANPVWSSPASWPVGDGRYVGAPYAFFFLLLPR